MTNSYFTIQYPAEGTTKSLKVAYKAKTWKRVKPARAVSVGLDGDTGMSIGAADQAWSWSVVAQVRRVAATGYAGRDDLLAWSETTVEGTTDSMVMTDIEGSGPWPVLWYGGYSESPYSQPVHGDADLFDVPVKMIEKVT